MLGPAEVGMVWLWAALVCTAGAGGARDADGDGVPDKEDLCRKDPEDRDGFADEDGCPELDNDRDGILDDMDGCPDEAEDADGFEDGDGCPEEGPAPAGAAARPLDALAALERALDAGDPHAARGAFAPAGWRANLVGGSGLSGQAMVEQALAKGWHLVPLEPSLEAVGDRQIVWCKVVDRASGAELDAVWVVLVQVDGRPLLLGAGEDEIEARALAANKEVDPSAARE